MNSLSFTTNSHLDWDKKIAAELLEDCQSRTGIPKAFKSHSIYAHREEAFKGGITFEQHGDILWIDSIWIDPSFRKQGLGKQLLQKVVLFAIQAKVKEVQLNTYFEEAHAFFLTCGFEDVAVIPHWKWGLTCYLMRKSI